MRGGTGELTQKDFTGEGLQTMRGGTVKRREKRKQEREKRRESRRERQETTEEKVRERERERDSKRERKRLEEVERGRERTGGVTGWKHLTCTWLVRV